MLVVTAGLSPTMTSGRRIYEVDLIGPARLLRAFEPTVGAGSVGVLLASMAAHLVPAAPEVDAVLDEPLDPGFFDRLAALGFDVDEPGFSYALAKQRADPPRASERRSDGAVGAGACCPCRQGSSTRPWDAPRQPSNRPWRPWSTKALSVGCSRRGGRRRRRLPRQRCGVGHDGDGRPRRRWCRRRLRPHRPLSRVLTDTTTRTRARFRIRPCGSPRAPRRCAATRTTGK